MYYIRLSIHIISLPLFFCASDAAISALSTLCRALRAVHVGHGR